MRVAPLAAAALFALASVPSALAGGTATCEVIPHGFVIGAIDDCSVSFTTGPGTMIIGVQTIFGNAGLVTIDGVGPGGSRIVIECALEVTAAQCFRAVQIINAAGAWTFTARAQAANALAFDSWTQLSITYP